MKSKVASKIKCDDAEERFECEFCKRSFMRENSLINHLCEPKRRWLWRDDKYAMMAFRAYQIFYEISMRSKKPKTQHDFIKSQYYSQFIKYGKYLVDIKALDPDGYTKFLIKLNVKLANWTDPRNYDVWVVEYGRTEHFNRAFERTAKLMDDWAKDTGHEWTDFFREITPSLAITWIKNGKIAPWALFTIGHDLLERLSNEQILLIKNIVDVYFWSKKIKEYKDEIQDIQNQFFKAGI